MLEIDSDPVVTSDLKQDESNPMNLKYVKCKNDGVLFRNFNVISMFSEREKIPKFQTDYSSPRLLFILYRPMRNRVFFKVTNERLTYS